MTLPIARERMADLLLRVRGKRILVVGDAMLDVYLIGEVDRISPEAPVPVVRVRERRNALGGAANVAQNVTALGADCTLVAAVGDDAGGRTLRQLAESLHVDAAGLLQVARPTTMKTRVVARSQQLVRVDEEEDLDLDDSDVARLQHALDGALERADAVILEDYDKGVLSPRVIRYVMDLARQRGIPVIVDPKFRHFFDFAGATIFKPNVRELEAALGAGVNPNDPSTLPEMVRRLEVEYLLLTLGERGMVLYGREGERARVATHAREVYDVVGAGDTVTAYLAGMLAAGATVEEAAIMANIAAGIEVGKLGAATVSAAEMLTFADEHAGAPAA